MHRVEPYKTVLSQGNAYWMARLAQVIYLQRPADNAPDEAAILANLQAEDGAFRSVTGQSRQSAQAALVEHEDYFCLTFRGTDELRDWLDNINVFSEQALFGAFHRGFLHSVQDVWDLLFQRYSELRLEKRRPLFLTGHSLGGAMATIAAAMLIHQDLPFTSVYTFGQPRAMTLDTSRIFNMEARGKCFRFQNNNDIVTRAPARLMGYSHVGTYLYVSEEQSLHMEPGFWLRFLDAIDGAVNALREVGIDAIADHQMERYLAAVTRWDYA